MPPGGDDLSSWLEASGLAGAVVYAGLTGIWVLLACCPAVSHLSGNRAALVDIRAALRRGRGHVTPAHGAGARRLCSLPRCMRYCSAWRRPQSLSPARIVLPRLTGELDSMPKEIVTTLAGLAAYVAIALGYSTIYQATVKLGLWRCVVESLDISNLAVLEKVTAAGQPASPVGEGLADALSVGGI